MNHEQLLKVVEKTWDSSVIPVLSDYIKIPNKSPAFDPFWEKNGFMDTAVDLIVRWCKNQPVKGMDIKVHRLPQRTPLISIEVPGEIEKTVLLYGHMDKQPEMTGWQEDLGPWTPVLRDDKLYGRGGADDGYSAFAALTAIAALQQQNLPHPRCVILIEACEESGSHDLPFYIENLEKLLQKPELVICLDSGCGNYDQLWCTTSLRGLIACVLKVEVLTEGVHSGVGTGIVPSSFRILRELISRIENQKTGKILLKDLQVKIPKQRQEEARSATQVLKSAIWKDLPLISKLQTVSNNPEELLLNRTWRPGLEVTGINGIPSLENAGNVFRPYTAVMLSIRIPPTLDAEKASKKLKTLLEKSPPYRSRVTVDVKKESNGWNAPAMSPWLKSTVKQASEHFFGKPALYWGEGGSIPFMGMLGEKFPKAQFVITGVLGPHSNAHGPNEFLHIPTAKKVTCCVAEILATLC